MGQRWHMSYYENCLSVVKADEDTEELLSLGIRDINLLPKERETSFDNLTVYYISDIHLEHQIIRRFPRGASDLDVENFIHKLADKMALDIFEVYLEWTDIIFFGGDTASSIELSRLFYTEFVRGWNQFSKEKYGRKRSIVLPLVQELNNIAKQIEDWKEKHEWTKKASKDLLEYSDKRVPARIKELITRERELKTTIHNEVGFNVEYYLSPWKEPKKRIITVLGNHEFWGFGSYEECVVAYRELFDDLRFMFLNNEVSWLRYNDNPNMWSHNVAIIGGTGFAGYNIQFNANNGIYRDTINRDQEIQYTKNWEIIYRKTVQKTQKGSILLIVLTHNPFHDWSAQGRLDNNCIYFSGHTHRNVLYGDEDANSYIYADNQIGYKGKEIRFKKAQLFTRYNPFASYGDGCYTVTIEDYLLFNRYSCIYISGVKPVEKCVDNGGQLYMIKEKGYYGFFVTRVGQEDKHTSIGTYICIGGCIQKVSNAIEISYFRDRFTSMVAAYLEMLSPYRNAQEMISKAVKSFGGKGTIHGYIIDIDRYNHIMLNPNDGRITIYHSPEFGSIKEYATIHELLAEQNVELLEQYEELYKLSDDSISKSLLRQNNIDGGFIKLDIKDSPYSGSRRMNQLQRLFDAKVLREWDESVLNTLSDGQLLKNNTESSYYLPE